MSRLNCGIPIYALTQEPKAQSKMTPSSRSLPAAHEGNAQRPRRAAPARPSSGLPQAGVVAKGDLIVLTYGDQMGLTGGTNTLTIVCVGDRDTPRH